MTQQRTTADAREHRADMGRAPRTYWHLQGRARKPDAYTIGSSRLMYSPSRGFEVQTPVAAWQRAQQTEQALVCEDWERFRDPRSTTYADYVERRKRGEIYVDGLLRSIEGSDYDRRLSPEWLGILDRVFAPLRYPAHGLQMLSAYLGSLAPSGSVAIWLLLQTGDELRLVQRLAYRLAQLRRTHPQLGDDAKSTWQNDPMWQPARRVLEELLCTYAWEEAVVAVLFALKPAFDEFFLGCFADQAGDAGDDILQKVLVAHHEDGLWHRECAHTFAAVAVDGAGDRARDTADDWLDAWSPRIVEAMESIATAAGMGGRMKRVTVTLEAERGVLRDALSSTEGGVG